MKYWLCLLLLWPLGGSAADLTSGIDAVARRDFPTALKNFRPLAAEGNVVAQVNLGNLYLKGLGLKQNYAEALRWFRLAADQNEPLAWTKLGVMHYYGLGVEKDMAEAAKWFRKAAEQDDPSAQTVLASLYAQGEGVKQDNSLAYYWYSRAAARGNEDASAGRDSLEEDIAPGERDEALRLLAEFRKQEATRAEQQMDRQLESLGYGTDLAPKNESDASDSERDQTAVKSVSGKSATHRRKKPARHKK